MSVGNPTGDPGSDPGASHTPPQGTVSPPLLPTGTHRRVAASVEVSSPSILYTLPYITYSNWSALRQDGRSSEKSQTWVFPQLSVLWEKVPLGNSPFPSSTPTWVLVEPPYLDGLSSVGLYSPSSRVPSSYKVLAMTRRNLSPGRRGQRSGEKAGGRSQEQQQQPQQISGWWQGAALAGLAQIPSLRSVLQHDCGEQGKDHTGSSVSLFLTDVRHHHGGDQSHQDTTAGVFMGPSKKFAERAPEGLAGPWAGTQDPAAPVPALCASFRVRLFSTCLVHLATEAHFKRSPSKLGCHQLRRFH